MYNNIIDKIYCDIHDEKISFTFWLLYELDWEIWLFNNSQNGLNKFKDTLLSLYNNRPYYSYVLWSIY